MAYREFCTDYLVIDTEKATLFDLIRIFYSNELQKSDFFDIPEGRELGDFPERLLLFLSTLAQMLFTWLKGPMEGIGSTLERWLNYPSTNGGFLPLLLRFLTGRVVKPDRTSATYMSLIGLLDTRVDLDESISKGDDKYDAALSMMAAKLSYENEAFARTVVTDHWQVFLEDILEAHVPNLKTHHFCPFLSFPDFSRMQMEFLNFYGFWNAYQEKYSTQAIVFRDMNSEANLVVVAFRGTEPYNADDWITDVNLTFYQFDNKMGKIHAGFMQALGLQKGSQAWPKEIEQATDQKPYAYYTLREQLRNIINNNENARIIVTGHSLGGALAILFPAILIYHEENALLARLEGIYTFGQPRVGDETFAEYMKDGLRTCGVRYYRYVYNKDIVPRVPFDDKETFYKHFAPAIYYNSCYRGKVLEDVPNKNYFSLLWVMPKFLNAAYEIIRSFIIPWTRGFEYREGWFQKLFRLVGLLIPGLPDHGPQDYVNVTRLGTSTSSLGYVNGTLQKQGRLKDD